jgi:hypothetical protein
MHLAVTKRFHEHINTTNYNISFVLFLRGTLNWLHKTSKIRNVTMLLIVDIETVFIEEVVGVIYLHTKLHVNDCNGMLSL